MAIVFLSSLYVAGYGSDVPQAFRSIPQDYQGAQWTRNIKSVRHQAQAPTQGSTRQDSGCLSGACSYKRGGRAQRLCRLHGCRVPVSLA
ncbi:hypothetical protein B0H19DRAFT_1136763 [Mycena capillaripes]|nr:hypothetical protein B0H19DRAFT_1197870 [Mycena capillaripes]KAJ6566036.1 hypothetical protein B0H19DRAFT_1136763 [Mycena capillaripes]